MRKTLCPFIGTVLLLSIVSANSPHAYAELWSQFRGNRGDGVSAEANLPTRWSRAEGLRWSIELPGRGNSSPAVTARRIDLTTQTQDGRLWVISIDRRNGEIFRKTHVGQGSLAAKGSASLYAHRHNPATPSPVADNDTIWAFFGTGQLVCLAADTHDVVWQRDLVKDYGAYDITFGMASSPRMFGAVLYLACMTKGPSYVVALDGQTGREIWKTDRRLPAADDGPDAYSTPFVYRTDNGISLVVSGSDHVNAYQLDDGKEIWQVDGLKINSPYGRVIASPVGSRAGIIVATTGNPPGGGLGHVMGVRFDPHKQKLWRYAKSSPDSSTPVVVGDNVFMIGDNGVASCLNIETGAVRWQKRLGKGPFHASLVAGDGQVYFLGIDGQCIVAKDDASGEILAENNLPGTFYATPAISGGVIYLRAYERLFAVSGH